MANIDNELRVQIHVKMLSSPWKRPRRPREAAELQVCSFFNLGARWGLGGERHAPAALPPGRKPSTHCTRGWVGPMAGHGYGKSRSHRDSIAGPNSPYRIAKPTTLTRPTGKMQVHF
jgi:hypothetical protein